MKKLFISMLSAVFFLSMLATPGFAGDKQHYRWQGVAIGVGAAILGHAILENCRDQSPPERVRVVERSHYRADCSPRHDRGHWEVRRIWVEPACEKVWNPAHYDRYGDWVPGDWIMVQSDPGYWKEERVWVSRR